MLVKSAGLVIEKLRVRVPAGAARECSSPESTLCADSLFGVRSTPMLLQWHVKEPGHSAKSAGGRLHLNTHTPLTRRSRSGLTMPLSRQSVGISQENELTRILSGNTRSQSSQLAEPLWTDPGLKSGINLRALNLKKKPRQRMSCRTFSQTSLQARKNPPNMNCCLDTSVIHIQSSLPINSPMWTL